MSDSTDAIISSSNDDGERVAAAAPHESTTLTSPSPIVLTAPPSPPPPGSVPADSTQRDFIGPDEVLSLPPPPSHPDMDDAAEPPSRSRTNSAVSAAAVASSAASKASSAAFSLAAAAKSRLALGSRMMLSPLVNSSSSSSWSNGVNRAASSDKLVDTAVQPPTTVASRSPVASSTSNTNSSSSSNNNSSSNSLSVASISHGIASLPGAAAVSSFGSMLFAAPSAGASSDFDTDILAAAAATAAADETLRQVAHQQRVQVLEDLVQSRRADWSYLKAMHSGSSYWLNVALLREQHVLATVGDKHALRRSIQCFYLGLGLGKLLRDVSGANSNSTASLAMDGCQLLEELEFFFASTAVQGMKLMVATSSSLYEPVATSNDNDAVATPNAVPRDALTEPFKPTLYKWNQRLVYRRLVTPPIPFKLDYREVMLSLFDILALVYSKLVEATSSAANSHVFHATLRFDDRIKRLVIEPLKKEFSAVALDVVTDELAHVRKQFGVTSGGSSATPVSGSSP